MPSIDKKGIKTGIDIAIFLKDQCKERIILIYGIGDDIWSLLLKYYTPQQKKTSYRTLTEDSKAWYHISTSFVHAKTTSLRPAATVKCWTLLCN